MSSRNNHFSNRAIQTTKLGPLVIWISWDTNPSIQEIHTNLETELIFISATNIYLRASVLRFNLIWASKVHA